LATPQRLDLLGMIEAHQAVAADDAAHPHPSAAKPAFRRINTLRTGCPFAL
jgi:hypothetical protein